MDPNISDNWCIPCLADGEDFKPSPMELESMYQRLQTGEIFELGWRNPGRRLPSPTIKDEHEITENANIQIYSSQTNVEFDFDDDAAPTSAIRVRTPNATPKGSAKKKTANFASVIDAMKKNKRTPGAQGTPTSSKE